MSLIRILKCGLAGLLGLTLAACGGGGGSAGDPVVGGGTGSGSSTSPTITVSLSRSTVTAASPATVTASVKTAAGAAVVGQVVSFASTGSLGSFSPTSALTDSSGNAVVTLSPASSSASGADTVVASAVIGSATLKATTGFQLTATNVSIASFTSDVGTLSAYGQTTLTVNLSGATATVPVNVAVSSSCVTKGLAELTPTTVSTGTGQATFTFKDKGCGSVDTQDTLQASISGTTATAALQLTLTAPTVASIAFVSASPDTVYLRGTGLAENSTVTFQVRDANGLGVRERNVQLELTTLAGGLTLDDAQIPVTKKSDANGNVTVRVNAGTVPTPVRVKATLSGSTIATVSSNLAVAVGLPSQNNFSLSQGILNIEGYDRDGATNTFSIIASDRMGNPVPAGTAINFVTSSGQVQSITFSSIGSDKLSHATASYQSSDPRPVHGRITTLAYALGEESFLDANGNNIYDAGEDYQDLGDVYLDRLFNGTYNAADDQFISLSLGGTDVCHDATSSLLRIRPSASDDREGNIARTFPGVPSRAFSSDGSSLNTCSSGWGRAYVRRAAQTVLSSSSASPMYGYTLPAGSFVATGSVCPASINRLAPAGYYGANALAGFNANDSKNWVGLYAFGSVGVLTDPAGTGSNKSGTLTLYASDANPQAFNPMAAGTTVTVAGTDGLSVQLAGGSPVPSSLSPTLVAVNYSFNDSTTAGTLTVSFTSPSGLKTSVSQFLYKGSTIPNGYSPCP